MAVSTPDSPMRHEGELKMTSPDDMNVLIGPGPKNQAALRGLIEPIAECGESLSMMGISRSQQTGWTSPSDSRISLAPTDSHSFHASGKPKPAPLPAGLDEKNGVNKCCLASLGIAGPLLMSLINSLSES